MYQLIKERRNTVMLSCLFVVCFTLMNISVRSRGGTTLVERALLTMAGPIMQAVSIPKRWVKNSWNEYFFLYNLREENEHLKEELSSLKGVSLRARELEAKIVRLEALLGGGRRLPFTTRLANIVGRTTGAFGSTLIIDFGSASGAHRNLPVVHEGGVVGRISRVGRWTSRVLLLSDSRSAVDILLQRSRASGVFGLSPVGEGEVRFMSMGADVKVGDLLISSGQGGVFPKGLRVARVINVGPKSERLFRKVEADFTADLNKIEEVLVIMLPGSAEARK